MMKPPAVNNYSAAAEQCSCGVTLINYLHFQRAQNPDEANHTLNIRQEQSHGPQPLIDCGNRMYVEATKPSHFHRDGPVGFYHHYHLIHDANSRRAPYNYMGQKSFIMWPVDEQFSSARLQVISM